ncbi:pleckstrin homology domain-containing family S member 1 isoform X2 [Danio aesculapii]|uniref:pleckstrin homology domain-containing family S member 1 isoform X2 n=1 Tax=Danio aesculapii TaxID=1142201 RepID=UPI0024BF1D7E|nr:pleckstrin homology domain-containing family S member 1 isoform X2 [Danio aesculapii]
MSNTTKSAMVEEIHTGYLNKSPPAKGIKSWKRRFFVLSKVDKDDYHLSYYRNNESRDKPLGTIDLAKISLLSTAPEAHSRWPWIQKHFKCPPSSVLFLTVETRDYFLIGQNSDDVDSWLNAITTALQNSQNKMQNTDKDNKNQGIKSISGPMNYWQPTPEDQPDEKDSEAALMSTSPQSHYACPRSLFSAPVAEQHKIEDQPGERKSEEPALMSTYSSPQSYYACPRTLFKAPVAEPRKRFLSDLKDEKVEEEEDESPEEATEYISMAKVQMALEDDQKADTERTKTNETETHVEKEICISQESLMNNLVLTEEEGKPCVSECRETQESHLFHKGDQILALNDLLTNTLDEIQTYLKRLSKDEVKLTIRRLPGSQPLSNESNET